MSNSIRNQETLLLAHVVTDLAVQSAGKRPSTNVLANTQLPAASTSTGTPADLTGNLPNGDPVTLDALAKELAQVFAQLAVAKATGGKVTNAGTKTTTGGTGTTSTAGTKTTGTGGAGTAATAGTGTTTAGGAGTTTNAGTGTTTASGTGTTTTAGAKTTTAGTGTTATAAGAKTTANAATTTSTAAIQEPAGPTGGSAYAYPTDSSGKTIPASQLEVAPSLGINSSQIFQGTKTGDCVFLGILGAIGQANPQYLSNLIKPATDANGKAETDAQGYPLYQITLTQPNGQPWTYTTDAKFPGGAALTSPDADGKQDIGVPLLEKAMAAYNTQFAVFQGTGDDQGYDGISGGDSTKIMQALTGSPGTLVDTQGMSTQQVTDLISSSLNKGVVSGINRASFDTLNTKTLPSGATVVPQAFTNGDEQWLYTAASGNTSETIPMAHAYSVVGADTSNNTVELFNPWGVMSSQNKGTATFTLPTEDYQALMDTTTVGNVNLT